MDIANKRVANAGEIFTEYWGIQPSEINDNIPSLTFTNTKKELQQFVRKNIHDFDNVLNEQKKQVV